jgi:hypothetical protein
MVGLAGMATHDVVSCEDYIRFMAWFANFEDGLGFDYGNVRLCRCTLITWCSIQEPHFNSGTGLVLVSADESLPGFSGR